jgi:NAD dependent epimerase/dehydratase family enzyme
MPGIARPWEEAAGDGLARRQVFFRMSLVLDIGTPVLDRLALLVRIGAGGRISTGKQWVSWIHVRDMLRALLFVLERDIDGILNVTSPEPVRNETLMRELRRHLRRPWSPPVPAPLVNVGAWLMGTDPALALTGRRCIPHRLLEEGFTFTCPRLGDALGDLFGAAPPGLGARSR